MPRGGVGEGSSPRKGARHLSGPYKAVEGLEPATRGKPNKGKKKRTRKKKGVAKGGPPSAPENEARSTSIIQKLTAQVKGGTGNRAKRGGGGGRAGKVAGPPRGAKNRDKKGVQ